MAETDGATVFDIDASQTGTPMRRSWELAVGCGDAWSILRADLQAQLRAAVEECGFRYLRCHGILSDELQVVRRGRDGALVYNWQLVDTVYDALLDCGLRPFVELGFMPSALASAAQTVFFYRANVTPPADYSDWSAFIAALVSHWRARYGADELRRWYFEVWNEANLGGFWSSTRDEYFRLYAETARAIKAVDPALRVGGPATTRGEWLPEFLAFCREAGAPVDFVSTHVYPDDDDFGKTDPDYTAIHARGGYLEALVARVAAEMGGQQGTDGAPLEVHWTEWNSSWRPGNPIHDTPNQAAYICRALHAVHRSVDSFAFWTVSDIFNEFPYPRSELHGGYGMQTVHGLPKPAFHAYALLHRLGERELATVRSGAADSPNGGLIDCWATRTNDSVQVLLSHYTPPGGQPAEPRAVEVRLSGLPLDRPAALAEYRIDGGHASVLQLWEAMGRPDVLTPEQVAILREAAALLRLPAGEAMEHAHIVSRGAITVTVSVPAGGVAFVTIDA